MPAKLPSDAWLRHQMQCAMLVMMVLGGVCMTRLPDTLKFVVIRTILLYS